MKKLITLLLATSFFAVANAADLTTVQAGAWTDGSTWGGAVPTATDNVFITDFTVDVNGEVSCANLTFGTATTLKDSCLVMGENATLTVRGLIGLIAVAPFIPTTDCNLMRGSHATSTLKLTGEALTGTEPLLMIADNVIKFVRPKNLIVAAADTRRYQTGNTQANTFDVRGGIFTIKEGTTLALGTRTAIGLVDGLNVFTIETGATVTSKILEGEFSGKKMPAAKMIVNGSLTTTGQTTIRHIEIGDNGIFKTSSGNSAIAAYLTWDGWWHNTSPADPATLVPGDFATPTAFTLAPTSTIEFNRTSAQNIPGTIPTNKVFLIWTNDVATSTYYTANPIPAYNVPYANIKLTGGGTKTIQSNLVATGNITIEAGSLVLPAGKVLVLGGTVSGIGTFANSGALINLSSADISKGTATATISTTNEVTLVAKPNAGYSLSNWTESGSPISSATFTPTDASIRTIVANWVVGTGLSETKANSYVTVEGRNLKLHGDVTAIEVYDAQGRRLLSQRNATNVNVKGNGIYIVRLHTAQGVTTQKVSVN